MPDVFAPLDVKRMALHVDSLEHLSSENAAAALIDLFLRTGSAQARVADPDEVRRLVRLDCRRRGCRFRTLGAHGVVLCEDERYEAFLASEDGAAHSAEMQRRMLSAFSTSPSAESPLRLVPPSDSDPL